MNPKFFFIVPEGVNSPGGGLKFLQALQRELARRGCLARVPHEATVFLFNSHHAYSKVLRIRCMFPNIPMVHRIDGPIVDYNTSSDQRHYITFALAQSIADGLIFQSQWSRMRNVAYGLAIPGCFDVINNAPPPEHFYPGSFPSQDCQSRVKIACTSWSSNVNKGFSSLKWMDENLDFSRFQVNFYGNCPVTLRNIHVHAPLPQSEIGNVLRKHHVFFFPSRIECCSNALLEALHCGLPTLAYNGSSNPELVGRGGELFDVDSHIPQKLEQLASNLSMYRSAICCQSFSSVVDHYVSFLTSVTIGRHVSSLNRSRSCLGVAASIVRAKLCHKFSQRCRAF